MAPRKLLCTRQDLSECIRDSVLSPPGSLPWGPNFRNHWESSNGNQGMWKCGKRGGEEAEFSLLRCVWWLATVLLNTDLEAVRTAVFKVIRTKFLMWGPKETFPGSRRKDGLEQWYSIRGGAILRRAAFRIYTHTHTHMHKDTCTRAHTYTRTHWVVWWE